MKACCIGCEFIEDCRAKTEEERRVCQDYCEYLGPTNDEWRKTCSAEEFADMLYRLCYHASLFGGSTKDEFVEWLKEKHNE